MPLLNDAEYHATMGTPMSLVMPDDEFTSIPLAQYVDSGPDTDLGGHDFSSRDVDRVGQPRR